MIPGEFYPIHFSLPLPSSDAPETLDAIGFIGDPAPEADWNLDFFVRVDGEGEPDTFEWGVGATIGGESFFQQGETGVSMTGDIQELDAFADGSAVLGIQFTQTTGHVEGDQWRTCVTKRPRQELFAVSEDGQDVVQLSDDPEVQPLRSSARWDPLDEIASCIGQRWEVVHVDGDGAEYGEVVEAGIYGVDVDFQNPSIPGLLVPAAVIDTPGSSTHTGIADHDWAPDGTRIVYSDQETAVSSSRPVRLLVTDVVAGRTDEIVPADELSVYDARWSPTGEWILFTSRSSDDEGGIERVRPDGSHRELLKANRDRPNGSTWHVSAHWSPMGSHFVWTRAESSGGILDIAGNIWRARSDGSKATQLTDLDSSFARPLGWRE